MVLQQCHKACLVSILVFFWHLIMMDWSRWLPCLALKWIPIKHLLLCQALAPVRHIQKITANICVISTKLCIAKPSIYLVKNDHCKKFKHSGGHCMSLKNNSGGQCFKINGWRLLLLTSQMWPHATKLWKNMWHAETWDCSRKHDAWKTGSRMNVVITDQVCPWYGIPLGFGYISITKYPECTLALFDDSCSL